jgi:hypothetical protein
MGDVRFDVWRRVPERASTAVELSEETKDDIHAFIVHSKSVLKVLNEAALGNVDVGEVPMSGRDHGLSRRKLSRPRELGSTRQSRSQHLSRGGQAGIS